MQMTMRIRTFIRCVVLLFVLLQQDSSLGLTLLDGLLCSCQDTSKLSYIHNFTALSLYDDGKYKYTGNLLQR